MEKMTWEKLDIKSENSLTNIRKIEFYPIKITISFKINPLFIDQKENKSLPNLLGAIGVVMQTVDNVPFKLNGIKFVNLIDTKSQILKFLLQ